MSTEIPVSKRILQEIIDGDRVLIILPEDRPIPLGEIEFLGGTDEPERVTVKVLRTSRARLKHVPVSDRVLNGTEDLMDTLVQLRQWAKKDLTSDDIVRVVRFEPVPNR